MRKQHQDAKEHACEICNTVFEQEADLQAHVKQLHYQTEFICNVCDKVCYVFSICHFLTISVLITCFDILNLSVIHQILSNFLSGHTILIYREFNLSMEFNAN